MEIGSYNWKDLLATSLPNEQWVPIHGYEGQYEISNLSRIRSLSIHNINKGYISRIKIRVQRISKGTNYRIIQLVKDSQRKTCKVHVLFAAAFIPNPNNKPIVNHLDGNKLNISVENLEWATWSENNKHAYDTGLKRCGEDMAISKLTNEQAVEIYKSSLSYTKLAKYYGISVSSIAQIKQGKTYKQAIKKAYAD